MNILINRRNSQYITHIRGIVSNLNEKLQQSENEAFDLHNQKPKVVLASLAGLETSLSQVLFKRWCEKEENLLLFVTSPPPGTLADSILNSHSQKQCAGTV